MAEIKSTLELVMERTKHFSLSEEEKQQQKQKEFIQCLNGLVNQYLNNTLKLNEVIDKLDSLTENDPTLNTKLIVEHLVQQIQLESVQQELFTLIEAVSKSNTKSIQTLCKNYQEAILQKGKELLDNFKKTLADQYEITGSAIVPIGLNADFKKKYQAIKENYEDKLTHEKANFFHLM
ncbi:MAG: hypothetical protein HQK77_09770 [Desulfobacterales bacterium]|nr:hypothetical protein [Desulfobacterales bacterium]